MNQPQPGAETPLETTLAGQGCVYGCSCHPPYSAPSKPCDICRKAPNGGTPCGHPDTGPFIPIFPGYHIRPETPPTPPACSHTHMTFIAHKQIGTGGCTIHWCPTCGGLCEGGAWKLPEVTR